MMRQKAAWMILVAPLFLMGLSCPPGDPDDGRVPVVCFGPDPQALRIEFRLIEATTATSGRVEIKGIVDNYGMEEFRSGQGQQSAQLFEGNTLVAENLLVEHEFLNLALDETISVEYERDWDTADEFLPSEYTLYVNLDPDIFIDGNEQNDDCNTNNNMLQRSTTDINALFSGG